MDLGVQRVARRAVLDAYLMGRRDPYLFELVPLVAEVMKRPYPELTDSVPRIQTVVREEEGSSSATSRPG